MSNIIKYKDILTMTLNDENNYIENIKCNLPVIGEGNDRICYLLPNNKILKVAKNIRASCINYDEITLWQNIKDKECIVQFPEIFEYEKDWGLYYIYERINMSDKALKEATELIPILDQADNAGYNNKGELTVIDAENISYTWFLKETNPCSIK
jgi:hypothetical protein